jgi:hypothetical protein
MFASRVLYVSLIEHPARLESGAGAGHPFTFVAIMPTSRTPLSGGPLGDDDARRLLQRWRRLPAVRTALGVVTVAAFLPALGDR